MAKFITIVESVREKLQGVKNLLNYLTSEEEHPNDEIINYKSFKKENFIKNTENNEKLLKKFRKDSKKAFNSLTYSQSFMFSLPPQEQKISNEKWNLIISDMIPILKEIYKTNDINFIYNNCFINVHNRVNQNAHLNIVMNKIFPDKMLDLSQRRFLYKLQTRFAISAQKHTGIKPTIKTQSEMLNEEIKVLKKENKNLIQIKEQNTVLHNENKKILSKTELIKWTLIFLHNAEKYKNDNLKKLQNLQKAKNNIDKMKEENFDKEEIEQYQSMYDDFGI